MLLAPHAPGIEAYESHSDLSLSQPSAPLEAAKPPSSKRWNGTVVLESDGQEESFAIGPDGCVWNLSRPAHARQDTPGLLLPTGLKASSFAASRDAVGQLVVFAAHGQQLCAVVQSQGSSDSDARHWRTTHSSKLK